MRQTRTQASAVLEWAREMDVEIMASSGLPAKPILPGPLGASTVPPQIPMPSSVTAST